MAAFVYLFQTIIAKQSIKNDLTLDFHLSRNRTFSIIYRYSQNKFFLRSYTATRLIIQLAAYPYELRSFNLSLCHNICVLEGFCSVGWYTFIYWDFMCVYIFVKAIMLTLLILNPQINMRFSDWTFKGTVFSTTHPPYIHYVILLMFWLFLEIAYIVHIIFWWIFNNSFSI